MLLSVLQVLSADLGIRLPSLFPTTSRGLRTLSGIVRRSFSGGEELGVSLERWSRLQKDSCSHKYYEGGTVE
jgi:hypothetical protein